MNEKTRDLTSFIVNYWLRKENRERLTLLKLQEKERDQLSRIQRRRRKDLEYLFDIKVPDRDTMVKCKRIKRRPQYSIEPRSKRQKLDITPLESVNNKNRGFWSSFKICFGF
jgi:hypothetical protein